MKKNAADFYADASVRAESSNRRQSARQQSSERLFAQVVLAEQPDGNDVAGATLRCMTTDCSLEGIAFVSDRPVPIGAMIDIWVDTCARPGKMFLSGQVRWCSRPLSAASLGHDHRVGVRLLASPATDLQEWQSIVS